VVVGYKKEVIMDYFKEYNDIDVTYVVQDKQLGTSHALLQAKDHVSGSFIVLAGDNIIDQESISTLIYDKSEYSMLIKEHIHPSKYGVVSLEKNILKTLVEKPQEELRKFISTGIYKFPFSIFDIVEELAMEGVYMLSAVIQSLLQQKTRIATVVTDAWMDIVYPWDLIGVNEAMLQHISPSTGGTIERGVTIKGDVSIGKDTTIYPGCYIVGPVAIGDGCEIGPQTCIFPSTAIGHNVVVHPFCEIRNSVIMEDVRIGSHSSVSHSVLGRGTVIDNHFTGLTGKAVIDVEGEFNKLEKIGVMIGEDCTIGSNVVVDPGRIIGGRGIIGSLSRIIEDIPSGSKVM
jgi:glucose-1-phosphate thymidylyltransferase